MKILTGPFSKAEWNSVVDDFADVSLLQTWEYAEASARTRNLEVCRVLFEAGGQIVGAAQGLTRALPFIGGGAVVINRGPIWQRNAAEPANFAAMLSRLRDYWVREKGMYLRVSPAIRSGELPEDLFQGADYQLAEYNRPWISARLDLSKPADTLRSSLRKNWASALKKAETSGIMVESSVGGSSLNQIRTELDRLTATQEFHSTVTSAFLGTFQDVADDAHKLQILTATHDGRALGGIAMARYGSVWEYLVSAINERGKRLNVGQLLLWSAVLSAKEQGYRWLDLGGMDPDGTPEGVLYFKEGLQAEPYTYIGDFEAYTPGLINNAIRRKLERALSSLSR